MGRSCFVGVIALIVFLGGIALGVWWLFSRLTALDEELLRVAAPGEGNAFIKVPGNYTIFFESRGVMDGKVFTSNANLGDMTIQVSSPSGAIVPLHPLSTSSTYDIGSSSGFGVYSFSATVPGEYRVVSEYDEGKDYGRFNLAIGGDFTKSILIAVFGVLGFVFGGLILAGLLVLVAVFVHPKVRQAAKGAMI